LAPSLEQSDENKIKIKIQKKIGKKESTYMIGGVLRTHLADPHDYFQKPDSYF
jgi:hypothetical protein